MDKVVFLRWERVNPFGLNMSQLLKFDSFQQMQQDERNVAAPVSAAVQRVTTPRPPRTANTTIVEVQECFLQLHILLITP